MIFRIATLYYFKCPIFNNNNKNETYKKRSFAYTQEKNVINGNCPEEAQKLDLLDKEFKSAILKHVKRMKGNHALRPKESMRMTSHQIQNINKEPEIFFFTKPNRNFRVCKYKIGSKKFSGVA